MERPNELGKTSFLANVLDPPSYGYVREGKLYVPTRQELFHEFRSHLNPFSGRRDWIALVSWGFTTLLVIPFFMFFAFYFSWKLFLLGFLYSMVAMGTHGTIYLHRYCTHRAFTFRHPIWRFFVRNLVIKILPEEVYVVSHHVHHWKSEEPGDPYNVHGGWLYCFLADANHQRIAQNLSEPEYLQLAKLLSHTGVRMNTYTQYRRWGALCHPARTVFHFIANWAFWFAVFYTIGGMALATAIFGMAAVWAFGVRTFNFDGHGRGKDQRREGIDFDTANLAINQVWPGYVAGEWHNNHHLYPNGARSGFLPYQVDLAWYFIRFYKAIGGVKSFRDYRADFYRDHYDPYLARRVKDAGTTEVAAPGSL